MQSGTEGPKPVLGHKAPREASKDLQMNRFEVYIGSVIAPQPLKPPHELIPTFRLDF